MNTLTCATRPAAAADNDALLALADACPMHGAISLHIDRRPDFFSFASLEEDGASIEVVDGDDGLAGCISVARRTAWINGIETPVAYVADLKVHPAFRRRGVADTLIRRAGEISEALVGREGVILCSTLAGNAAMQRRAAGADGCPVLRRIATVRAWSIPLLRHPGAREWRQAVTVSRAGSRDAEEMAGLWNSAAARRHFTSPLAAEAFMRWMSVPGFSYRLARRRTGRLAGFIGVWDQRDVRQLRVLRYSPSLARNRALINAVAPLLGAPMLPRTGEALRHIETMQCCVPGDDPGTLRALASALHRELRGTDAAFYNISLDARDPLAPALRGFWAQPTDIDIRVTSACGSYTGPSLDDRPVHYETALA